MWQLGWIQRCLANGLVVLLLLTGHAYAVPTDEIVQMLQGQEDAWNRGDLDAYMQGYWKSDQLRFVSNGKFRLGWEETRAAYRKNYPNKEARGELSFAIRDIKMLSNSAALVVGRWDLHRVKDAPTGVFTLLVEKIDGRWVITLDHSSD